MNDFLREFMAKVAGVLILGGIYVVLPGLCIFALFGVKPYQRYLLRRWLSQKGYRLLDGFESDYQGPGVTDEDLWSRFHTAAILAPPPPSSDFFGTYGSLTETCFWIKVEDQEGRIREGWLKFGAGWWHDISRLYVIWDPEKK